LTIKSLFFDFGNVLAFFDHRKACRKLAEFSNRNFSGEAIYQELFQLGGLENQYDRGDISSESFIEKIRETFHLSASEGEIENAWCDIFSFNHPIIDLLSTLKNNQYPLFLASNTNPLHYRWFKTQYARELSILDDEIISFKVGFRKPERGFFNACLERAGVPAAECVFIDDKPDFIEAAQKTGMNGIQFTSSTDLVADLEKLGIKTYPY
jgi:FMN phosphatase YigB (HAD superfamily)